MGSGGLGPAMTLEKRCFLAFLERLGILLGEPEKSRAREVSAEAAAPATPATPATRLRISGRRRRLIIIGALGMKKTIVYKLPF